MNPLKQERIHRFFQAFLPAITHAHQYTTSHQLAVSSIHTAYNYLIEAMGTEQALSFLLIDDRVVVDRETLEDSPYSSRLMFLLRSRGIQSISMSNEITIEELTAFITRFISSTSPFKENEFAPNIRIFQVGLMSKTEDLDNEKAAEEDAQGRLQVAYQFKAIERQDHNLIANLYGAVRENKILPDKDIKRVVTNIVNAIKQGFSLLITFSPLRVLDEYTFTHSTNVCILTLAQAMVLKVNDEMLQPIGVSAILHDIGKLFVPEEILNKPGKLTDEDWEYIRQHPRKGAEYLLDKGEITPLATIVAYEHHMQYNYSGYPKVPSHWQQNLCSQMTTIADYFDALRTKRVYRDSIEMEIIAEQMTNMAGSNLNPLLINNFLLLLKNLSSGRNEVSI
jgi:HD-GYP domain-containing protein (c-di-GMP phosphodiesterase class II)